MPQITDVKETCLYVEDLKRARSFYEDVLGLTALIGDDRFCALNVASRHVLLLFLRGASDKETTLPMGGMIPPHDGSGQVHVGFAAEASQLAAWEAHLAKHGIEILSQVTWPRGGRSLYFRDPDCHLLEILTPGVWTIY